MRIKSIVNVITNSSDETFIVKTNESIEEVNEWLSENVRGWCNLQRVDSVKSPIISEIVDGFDYIYDSKDINSIKKYHIEQVFCNVERGSYNVTKEELEIRANLCDKWLIFLVENRRLINKIARKRKKESWVYDCYRLPKIDEIYLEAITLNNGNVIYDLHPYYIKYINKLIPTWLYKKFITQYCSENKTPSNWELPKDMDINTYIGGYGFTTTDENSISYEDMEKIVHKYTESKHWHLG
jgi:hypothetical protein